MPRNDPSRTPASPARRGAVWTALVLSLAGLALSILLARLHSQAHAGVASFCAINEVVNCDVVATSRYSVFLGLPVAIWGALGYGLAAGLAAAGLSRTRPESTWPSGLLFVVGAIAVAASLVLALVSKLAIGAWCLLCMGSWAVALALLAAAARACGAHGVREALRADLAVIRASPGRTAALVIVGLLATAVAAVAYPRYWERPRGKLGPGAGAPTPPAAMTAAAPGGPRRNTVVVEYSDYECPFCARAHEKTREVLARRPDVSVVRRQFPLDATCNPLVTRSVHPGACDLARIGICADEQGRFTDMDDALFRNQREKAPPMEVARRLGLDVPRLEACVGSPATQRRLEADVAAAVRDGVRATPTYVVEGVSRAGEFPEELLPPPPGPAR